MPQRWDTRADGLAIHLVFNFDYGIVRAYAGFDNTAIRQAVLDAAASARSEAERAGLRVVGVQLDFDCPTRRLPKYAELLRGLHREFKRRSLTLSITALQTWFRRAEVRDVMEAVDFTVPQYYEAEVPKSLEELAPISRLDMMRDGLRAAGGTGLPFRAGLPAYGHATVYDRSGRLVGMFRDMGIDDVARPPGLPSCPLLFVRRERQTRRAWENDRRGDPRVHRRRARERQRADRLPYRVRPAHAGTAAPPRGAAARRAARQLPRSDRVPLPGAR